MSCTRHENGTTYNEQLNVISVWVVSSVRRVHTMNVSKSTQL